MYKTVKTIMSWSCCGSSGQYEGRIVDEVYTDVAFAHDKLYAARFGLNAKARLEVYEEDKGGLYVVGSLEV